MFIVTERKRSYQQLVYGVFGSVLSVLLVFQYNKRMGIQLIRIFPCDLFKFALVGYIITLFLETYEKRFSYITMDKETALSQKICFFTEIYK